GHQHIILQSKDGYFLRFDTDEISELKKTAVGVRGMRLGSGDYIEQVYCCQPGSDGTIPYKEKLVPINKIKLNKRDSKGTKIRV
ncbi:MAG: DNA topoisomerase, partial [Lachnospiraceae bacterium]|nr:DNA topoisomerase [Lachnospiraceae bacterium]